MKTKRLTQEEWEARAEAFEEAAEHLGLDWTHDKTERAQGNVVADKLRQEALKCHWRANNAVKKAQ